MEFSLKHNSPESARGACQIITVTQARKLSSSGLRVDKAGKGFLSSILKRGDMDGKPGQTLLLPAVPGLAVQRVLLVGCGKTSEFNLANFNKAAASAASAVDNSGASDAVSFLADLDVKDCDLHGKVRAIASASSFWA